MRVADTLIRNRMITQWLGLGRAFGLSDSCQAVPTNGTRVANDHYERKTCHFQLCLCHQYAGAHEMRVCTGCWKVFYCTTKCQAAYVSQFITEPKLEILTLNPCIARFSDWHAGHHLVCQRVRRRRVIDAQISSLPSGATVHQCGCGHEH